MFVGITNTPRDYAWGSRTAIAEVLGTEPSGGPEAELWLGAHPANPSWIVDPSTADGHATLDAWIAADPARALGAERTSDTLPFLLKLLAADGPLSIQAHPSIAQAKEGYAREDAAGVALDASERTYKDELHKPELALALSETFEALAGFRSLPETQLLVEELRAIAMGKGSDADRQALDDFAGLLAGEEPLKKALAFALGGSDGAAALVAAVGRLAPEAPAVSSFRRELDTLVELGERYPGDPGVVVALLLNRVSLPQGQAVYLPSGNMHAYLSGLAVELMAASDNVIRGGLTGKYVDTEELQKVVLFEPVPAPVMVPEDGGPGVEIFRPDVPDFALARITVGGAGASHGYQLAGPEESRFTISGPAIALAVGGTAVLTGAVSTVTLGAGESAFVTPDEGELRVTGSATVFVATTNR